MPEATTSSLFGHSLQPGLIDWNRPLNRFSTRRIVPIEASSMTCVGSCYARSNSIGKMKGILPSHHYEYSETSDHLQLAAYAQNFVPANQATTLQRVFLSGYSTRDSKGQRLTTKKASCRVHYWLRFASFFSIDTTLIHIRFTRIYLHRQPRPKKSASSSRTRRTMHQCRDHARRSDQKKQFEKMLHRRCK